jgi:pimeloyl-ACP methyl ester carboxylesterase
MTTSCVRKNKASVPKPDSDFLQKFLHYMTSSLRPFTCCRWILSAALFAVCLLRPLAAEQPPAGSAPVDLPQDRTNPATMQTFQIPSHGAMLNALAYVAAGQGRHPAVVLLHGFPGNERNLDLAQDIRRAGWDVLYFNYRGSWGSSGDFSFSNAIEDTAAALAYLRQPAIARLLRLDPSRIVLIGHSMGGFMAVQGAAADPAILAFGLISAADLGGRIPQPLPKEKEEATIKAMGAAYAREGMAPLAGCTPEGLARETLANAAQWNFLTKVDALKSRPALIVTSNDGLAPGNDAFAAALKTAGNDRVTTLHLATDHAYSDQRRALSNAVLDWLATLPSPAAKH